MKISIPNSETIELNTLILDLNGTLTVRGLLVEGVTEKIQQIKNKGLNVILFSGDTRGNGKRIADELGIQLVHTQTGEEKKSEALKLNPDTCVAIGNGLIDARLFSVVKISIATLQAEGIHLKTFNEADILVPSIIDALDLLIDEANLVATLRP
jgi:soluble P-type ATPase